jgi:tetrahydromethanopterin S-methyltransferase subunit G
VSNELKDVLKTVIDEALVPMQELVVKRLDGIEQRLDGIEQRLDGIEQRLDLIEQKQDIIIDQVVQNSEDITIIKNEQQNIKETLIQIVQTQQNQHRIIELLAVRSIEQEAALKRVI